MAKRYWARIVAALALCTSVAACSGEGPEEDALGGRLPVVAAPLDTSAAVALPAGGGSASGGAGTLLPDDSAGIAWDAPPPRPSLPKAAQLVYTRYRNEAYRYSIAYPDTLLRPGDDVGNGRGRVFASADGEVRMLVYAAEDGTSPGLGEQYQAVLDEADLRATYHVLEPDWYVVSGYSGGRKVYEKGLLRGRTLVTFRIQYPEAHEDYYDAVAATMAISLGG